MKEKELVETVLWCCEVHRVIDHIHKKVVEDKDDLAIKPFEGYRNGNFVEEIAPYLYQFKTSLMFIILPISAIITQNDKQLCKLGWNKDANPENYKNDTSRMVRTVRNAIAHFLEKDFKSLEDKHHIVHRNDEIVFRSEKGTVSFTPEEYRRFVENTIKVSRTYCREKLSSIP